MHSPCQGRTWLDIAGPRWLLGSTILFTYPHPSQNHSQSVAHVSLCTIIQVNFFSLLEHISETIAEVKQLGFRNTLQKAKGIWTGPKLDHSKVSYLKCHSSLGCILDLIFSCFPWSIISPFHLGYFPGDKFTCITDCCPDSVFWSNCLFMVILASTATSGIQRNGSCKIFLEKACSVCDPVLFVLKKNEAAIPNSFFSGCRATLHHAHVGSKSLT